MVIMTGLTSSSSHNNHECSRSRRLAGVRILFLICKRAFNNYGGQVVQRMPIFVHHQDKICPRLGRHSALYQAVSTVSPNHFVSKSTSYNLKFGLKIMQHSSFKHCKDKKERKKNKPLRDLNTQRFRCIKNFTLHKGAFINCIKMYISGSLVSIWLIPQGLHYKNGLKNVYEIVTNGP